MRIQKIMLLIGSIMLLDISNCCAAGKAGSVPAMPMQTFLDLKPDIDEPFSENGLIQKFDFNEKVSDFINQLKNSPFLRDIKEKILKDFIDYIATNMNVSPRLKLSIRNADLRNALLDYVAPEVAAPTAAPKGPGRINMAKFAESPLNAFLAGKGNTASGAPVPKGPPPPPPAPEMLGGKLPPPTPPVGKLPPPPPPVGKLPPPPPPEMPAAKILPPPPGVPAPMPAGDQQLQQEIIRLQNEVQALRATVANRDGQMQILQQQNQQLQNDLQLALQRQAPNILPPVASRMRPTTAANTVFAAIEILQIAV